MIPLLMLASFFAGLIFERIRKVHDMRLDADNGVTFIGSVPHILRRYGQEQNYDD